MNIIEKIVGHKNYMVIKQRVKYIRDKGYFIANKKMDLKSNMISVDVFEQKNRHVFFGYYDIPQLNMSETKALVHSVNKNADVKKDEAEIGYYDIKTHEYIKISATNAWSWQQGARLRWWPDNENYIAYNDVSNGRYVCKKVNLSTNKVERIFCRALYDIDPTGTYGLSLNFSRLQRLRPGYGYSSLPDETVKKNNPVDDGIFYLDLQKNESRLLISLAQLKKKCNDDNAIQHYVNHISISPDGRRFMFFHIWTLKNSKKWKTQLCVLDKDGYDLKILEAADQVSHYDWIDNDRILVTGYTSERHQIYSIYDINRKEKEVLNYYFLDKDGHPSILRGGERFITDTYPKAYDMQTLFECNMKTNSYRPLLKIHSNPLMYEEKRCDLHPRISPLENFITIDSTFESNLRKVILIENWKE